MRKFTISPDEAKRIQKIEPNDRLISFDYIELEQLDDEGNNLGIIFTVHQVCTTKEDVTDPDLPPSYTVLSHSVGISDLKMIDGWCKEIVLSETEKMALAKTICNLVKYQ